MNQNARIFDSYIAAIPPGKKDGISQVREALRKIFISGFIETMSYGVTAFVVPQSLYSHGYHTNPAYTPYILIAELAKKLCLKGGKTC